MSLIDYVIIAKIKLKIVQYYLENLTVPDRTSNSVSYVLNPTRNKHGGMPVSVILLVPGS